MCANIGKYDFRINNYNKKDSILIFTGHSHRGINNISGNHRGPYNPSNILKLYFKDYNYLPDNILFYNCYGEHTMCKKIDKNIVINRNVYCIKEPVARKSSRTEKSFFEKEYTFCLMVIDDQIIKSKEIGKISLIDFFNKYIFKNITEINYNPKLSDNNQRILDTILREQNKISGIFSRTINYQQAYKEIENGKKISHWIWYIWPTLKSIRPGTSRPEFLLPEFYACIDYLNNSELCNRLVDITEIATTKLKEGISAYDLLDSGSGRSESNYIDRPKFIESVTLFAVASKLLNNDYLLNVFCNALNAYHKKENAELFVGSIQAIREEIPIFPDIKTVNELKELNISI